MCVYCVENVSTASTYIALNALDIVLNTLHYLMLCIDSVDIDSIECMRDPCLVSTVSTYIVLMVWL